MSEMMDIRRQDPMTEQVVSLIKTLATSLTHRSNRTRDIKKIYEAVEQDVLSDMCIARECVYALPMRSGAETKYVWGPSIRLAEIIKYHWQDIWVFNWVVGDFGDKVVVRALAYDMITNNMYMSEISRSLLKATGQRYPEDLVQKLVVAAQRIAERDAIFNLVPAATLVNRLVTKIRAKLLSDAHELNSLFEEAIEFLKQNNVSVEQIASAVNAQVVNGKYEFDSMAKMKVIELANAVRSFEISPEGLTNQNGISNVEKESNTVKDTPVDEQAEGERNAAQSSSGSHEEKPRPMRFTTPPKVAVRRRINMRVQSLGSADVVEHEKGASHSSQEQGTSST